jgi:signal transduction histidine kinase
LRRDDALAKDGSIKVSRRLRTFFLCNTVFFQAVTEQELLQSVCDIVAAEDGLCLVLVGYCEDEAAKIVRPVAKAGTDPDNLDSVSFSWREEATQTPVALALRSGKPCCVNDISNDSRFSHWQISAYEAGHQSCLALPLVAYGKRQANIDLRGALYLCSQERGFFDESAIEHYASLATCLTFATAALRRALTEGLTSGIASLRADEERKRARDNLRTMQAELGRATRAAEMGQMAASIAHEIRQPLAAITANGSAGLAWLSRPSPDLHQVRAALEDIVTDVHRASEVITGIRSMFMKDEPPKDPYNINEILREVLMLMGRELERQLVSVHTDFAEELPFVCVSRVQVQQVIFNLIRNAVEAMSSANSEECVLYLRSETIEHSGIMVTIGDTGPGIDKANIDRIFDVFFTTKSDGMGLGLAICRSIIASHRGRLWASPRDPHGTVFHIVLPSSPANVPKVGGNNMK